MSGLRLQMLLSTQLTAEECKKWGESLSEDISHLSVYNDSSPILSRLIDEPIFALDDLRHNAISSGLLIFTSATEYYLKEAIRLCLLRNSKLRRKALSKFQIPALDLEDHQDLDGVKMKYIESLSSEHSKGGHFSDKLKKAAHFLDIKAKIFDKDVLVKLDSIWSLRNRLAHTNHLSIDSYKIKGINTEIEVSRSASKDEYLSFVVSILDIMTRTVDAIEQWDRAAMEVWPADNFINR